MKKILILILTLLSLSSCNNKDKESSSNNSKDPALTEQTDLFEFSIPDTISVGKHIGRITKYKRKKIPNRDYLLSVIVSNQYEENKIEKDTFSDGSLNPFFGLYGFKTGKQEIDFIIEEQIVKLYEKDQDSFLGITKLRHPYTVRVTVVEEGYISDLEKRLLNQMSKE